MRHSILTLWLATLLSLFAPALACKKRFYTYTKEYQNCNEALKPGVFERIARECATFPKAFYDMNPSIEQQFGRDISSVVTYIGEVSNDNPNCIAYTCVVTAWRYHEWQLNMEHKSLPNFNGWSFSKAEYGKGTNDC